MRRRLRLLRPQRMARPSGGPLWPLDLSPRGRTIAAWLAVVALLIGVAFVVGGLGGEEGGPEVGVNASPSGAPSPLPIAFGTVLGPTGEVDPASQTSRFATGDTFAYSIAAAPPPDGDVYVE